MNKIFTSNYPIINLYKKSSFKSEIVTQMIYGESFEIINKSTKWIKIKTKEDNYTGYIRRRKFISYLKPTHKVSSLFANIYKQPNFENKIGKLPYIAKIKVVKINSKFAKFQNKWIEARNIKPLNYKNKDIFKDIKIFKNTKYKWGGKTFEGIDCSALVQIFFNFNNKFYPRDSSQQVKFLKKNINLKNIKKNDIIYWNGHVAVALSSKKLIHAYGPKKKTLIMNISQTVKIIKKTANLEVVSVKRI
jgi:cell wall-associated NlpC family hydrolase